MREDFDSDLVFLKRWWTSKYNLPPSSPAFQNQTKGELLLEWTEDLYARKQDVEKRLAKGEGDTVELTEAYRKLCEFFDEEATFGDPLVAHWEWQIARGEEPDLDMTMDDLKRIKRTKRG